MKTGSWRWVVGFALTAGLSAATAAVKTWDGEDGGGEWQLDLNWADNLKPAAGDELHFAGTQRLANTNDFAAGTAFGPLVFDAGAGPFVLAGSGIQLAVGITNAAPTNQTINVGLDLTADVTVYADQVVTLNGALTGAGGLVKDGFSNVVLTASNRYAGETLVASNILVVTHAQALGDTAAGTVIGSINSQLQVDPGAGVRLVFLEPLTLRGTAQYSSSGALQNRTGSNEWAGPIGLAENGRIRANGGSRLVVSGGVTAPTNYTCVLGVEGPIVITNNPINTAGGQLTVHGANTARLDVACAVGNVEISYNATLVLGVPDATPLRSPYIFGGAGGASNRSGTLDLNGNNLSPGSLESRGDTQTMHVIRSALPATLTLTATSGGNKVYGGRILGDLSLVKQGTQTQTLSNNLNSYTGPTTVEGGTLRLGLDETLPDTTDVLLAGGTLDAMAGRVETVRSVVLLVTAGTINNANTPSNWLVAAGTGVVLDWRTNEDVAARIRLAGAGGSLRVAGYSMTNGGPALAGTLDLGGEPRTVDVANVSINGSDLFLNGAITNGGVVKVGAGTMKFGTATPPSTNTYAGLTDVREGELYLQFIGDHILDTAPVQVTGGKLTIDYPEAMGAFLLVTGQLSGVSNAAVSASGFEVQAGTVGGVALAGTGGLVKTTAGTVTLSPAAVVTSASFAGHTLTGPVAVSNGTLVLNTWISGAGPVAIATGATITGTGILTGPVTSHGVVAPGNGRGALRFDGSYTQAADGTLSVELAGTTPATQHDVLRVGGDARLGGTLQVSRVSFAPAAGQSFTVLTAAAVSGSFGTLALPALSSGLVWQAGATTSAVVLLVATQATYNYTTWSGAFGLTTPETGDEDQDGDLNLAEYAFGSNPTNPLSRARILGSVTGGYLRAQFLRNTNALDLNLYVQGADAVTNGVTWTAHSAAFGGDWGGDASVTETATGTPATVIVRDVVPAAPARFMRVVVEKP